METEELSADELAEMQGTTPAPEVAEAIAPAETPVETPAEETPAEAPTEEVKAVEPTEDKTIVPSWRLREEADARRALEEKVTKMETAFDLIKEKYDKPEPPPEPSVNYEEDPTEHIRQQGEIDRQANQAEVTQLRADLDGLTEEQRQQVAQIQFQNTVNGQVTDFKSQTPDYDAAAEFYRSKRELEYKAVGMTDEKQLEGWLDQEWQRIATGALQNNKNPAQAVYELAKGYGFKANGTPQVEADKKLETIEKGQAASSTLASGGGATGEASLEQIAEMSDNDLMKVLDDPNGWEKLLKGSG